MPNWTNKREFSRLSGTLAISERAGFEKAALSFLRAIYPAAMQTPSSRSFDQSGVDHLVWGDDKVLPLVVQCKGFGARVKELGSSEISQCLDAISTFKNSGLKADKYILIHNRDGRNADFRERVQDGLNSLVSSGVAGAIELYDRQVFVRTAFDHMYSRVIAALTAHPRAGLATLNVPPLSDVPIRTTTIVIDQYKARTTTLERRFVTDPSEILIGASRASRLLLLGEYGIGKTTVALRSTDNGTRQVVYVQGAVLSDNVKGTKDLVAACWDTAAILAEFDEEDQPTIELLLRPCTEWALRDPENDLLLIIDGLDESAGLAHRGGLQKLLNSLQPLSCPVVLTMRSEFWERRRDELEYVWGMEAEKPNFKRQEVLLLELTLWNDEHVVEMVDRHRSNLSDERSRQHLIDLRESVESGLFARLYGDIPRRPLFLHFIAETVAAQGMPEQATDRVTLISRWIDHKILRDIIEPMARGGTGSATLIAPGESSEAITNIVREAMTMVSEEMSSTSQGAIELNATCDLSTLREICSTLGISRDPLGLLLHGFLVPAAGPLGQTGKKVSFSHRAFQEFFLALAITRNPTRYSRYRLPGEITMWIDDLTKAVGPS